MPTKPKKRGSGGLYRKEHDGRCVETHVHSDGKAEALRPEGHCREDGAGDEERWELHELKMSSSEERSARQRCAPSRAAAGKRAEQDTPKQQLFGNGRHDHDTECDRGEPPRRQRLEQILGRP